ncbi:hypothetical protein ABZV21_21500, partial [Streptomyces clavifer]
MPCSPATLDAELHAALAALDAAAAPWREALEDLDEDVLAEAAAEARAFGAGPAAAVDELVRGLLGQLADWQQSIGELGRALTTATEGRPPPGWSIDAGRAPRTSGGAGPAPRCSRPSHATTTLTCSPPSSSSTVSWSSQPPVTGASGRGHPRRLRGQRRRPPPMRRSSASAVSGPNSR